MNIWDLDGSEHRFEVRYVGEGVDIWMEDMFLNGVGSIFRDAIG